MIVWGIVCSTGQADDQTLPELLIKHREAMGGDAAIKAVRTLHTIMDVEIMTIKGTVEIWTASPNKQYIDLQTPVMSQIQGDNGEISWTLDHNQQITVKEKDDRLPNPQPVILDYQYLFPQEGITVTDEGEEERDGIRYRVLSVEMPGQEKPRKLFIDPVTFLVMKEDGEEDGIAATITYGRYRAVDGIQIPESYTQQADIPGMPPTVFTLKSVRINEEPSPGLFDPPTGGERDFEFPANVQELQIPMDIVGEHLFVSVKINGTGPYRFLLDSGAGTTILDVSLVKSLGLEMKEGMKALGVGGLENIGAVSIDSMELDGFKMKNLRLYASDFGKLRETFNMSFDGVLGFDLFNRTIVKLDFVGKTVTIIDPTQFTYEGEGESIPGEIKGNLIHINGNLDGEYDGVFRVDTGAGGGVHLHVPFVKANQLADKYQPKFEVQVSGAGGNQSVYLVRAKSLKIGSFDIPNPLATIPVSEETAGAMAMLDSAGTIGNAIWSKFTVYFDYPHNQLILESKENLTEKMQMNKAGFAAIQKGEHLEIANVLPGTPAAEAGLQVGDQLLKINRTKSGDLSTEKVAEILNGPEGTTLKLKVLRGGKKVKIKLTLREYL